MISCSTQCQKRVGMHLGPVFCADSLDLIGASEGLISAFNASPDQ
uniref:Uncharacterized protein n=1 Tax=Pseudomonas aeruginosa TaxID=287 RepID=A0A5P9WB30_PSEAI|nr:hypothetical protein pNK546KPC_0462 [Pseudomonas aeruginosa]